MIQFSERKLDRILYKTQFLALNLNYDYNAAKLSYKSLIKKNSLK